MLANETDPISRDTINKALLEIATFPPQGGMSAITPQALATRRVEQQRSEQALLTYVRGHDTASQFSAVAGPADFLIVSVHPNPFNPVTTLTLAIPREGGVCVRIYNLLGQQVAEPLNRRLEAGLHTLTIDGSRWASGVYVAVAEQADQTRSQKMLLLK
jgi:hypothetical protein